MELLSTLISLYAEVKGIVSNRQHYLVYLKLLLWTCKDFWTKTKSKRWFRTFRKCMSYCKPFLILYRIWRMLEWLHDHGWPF